jgi:hypothetical protein
VRTVLELVAWLAKVDSALQQLLDIGPWLLMHVASPAGQGLPGAACPQVPLLSPQRPFCPMGAAGVWSSSVLESGNRGISVAVSGLASLSEALLATFKGVQAVAEAFWSLAAVGKWQEWPTSGFSASANASAERMMSRMADGLAACDKQHGVETPT